MNSFGLGSLDPNVFPLDAIELQEESASSKIIAGRDEWRFGSAISGSKWVTAREYKAGDIVWNPTDKLTYVALADNASIEPDYTDSGVEGVTWEWIAGSITGYVAGRGWWQKHADGTLRQRFTIIVDRTIVSNINVGTYGWSYYTHSSETWVFPIPSISDDIVLVGGTRAGGYVYFGTPTTEQVTCVSIGPVSAADVEIWVEAEGRWKE